jgi:hypothetical protein
MPSPKTFRRELDGKHGAVLHPLESASFTPASRRSAGSIDGLFGARADLGDCEKTDCASAFRSLFCI